MKWEILKHWAELYYLSYELIRPGIIIYPKYHWLGGTCIAITQEDIEVSQEVQVSGGEGWPTIKLLLCLGFWTLWRLLWAGRALRKEKHIAAYWSRVLRATNCCCHWHRDQLLLEKTGNFPDPSPQLCSLPLPDLNKSRCFPPCWHTMYLMAYSF